MPLTDQQLKQFRDDGYLILPHYLPSDTVAKLRNKVVSMLNDFDLSTHPMTRFSTGESAAHVGDDYFLNSNDKIRFFFEEGAFDPVDGSLTKPKEKAINKIGHALHDIDPDFRSISITDDMAQIAQQLDYGDPRVLQSMVICKQPEIGGAVPSHQDSTFLYTSPTPSATGFWFALEDCTKTNGCLSFAPGTHRTCGISRRFVRASPQDGNGGGAGGTTFEAVDGVNVHREPEEDEFVLGECEAGSLVLIHGNLLHKSEANRSPRSRYIYTFHIIDVDETKGQRYDEKNWLQPPEKGFTRLYT